MKAPGELWTVARCLGDVLPEVVFVGGMIRELLMTDPAAGPARPTQDVDCIVDAVSWMDYARLSERLRTRGFAECTEEGAPICRWVVKGVRVDVMPIDPVVLGFSNVWYPSAIEPPASLPCSALSHGSVSREPPERGGAAQWSVAMAATCPGRGSRSCPSWTA